MSWGCLFVLLDGGKGLARREDVLVMYSSTCYVCVLREWLQFELKYVHKMEVTQ